VEPTAQPPQATSAEPAPPPPQASSLRRVLRGFALLSSATVVGQVIGFVALAIASRRLGPHNLGAYNFALSLALYFALFVNFGFSRLGIRDIARDPSQARRVGAEVVLLRCAIGVVGFALLVALAPVLAPDHTTRRVIPITAAMLLIGGLTLDWLFQGLQRMRIVAIAQVAGQAAYGALVPLVLVGGATGAIRFAWLNMLGLAITGAVTLVAAWRAIGSPFRRVSLAGLWRRVRLSVPIGISFAIIQIYYSIDSVMLGYLKSTEEVGQYAVAYKVPLGLISIGVVYVAALYPHAAELFVQDRKRLRRQVMRLSSLTAAIALPLGVGATVAGSGLMPVLFGSRYEAAGTPFVLLAWAVAIIFVSMNFGNVLLACGDERRYALGVTCGAVVNVGLNLALIPAFGTTGAAIDTIAAEVVVLAYMLWRFTRVLGPIRLEWGRIGRSAVASALMAGGVLLVPASVGAVARCVIGAVLFVAFALALRVVTPAELAGLRRRDVDAVASG
jgi:O-antigen/teichoic acid export membrane protein